MFKTTVLAELTFIHSGIGSCVMKESCFLITLENLKSVTVININLSKFNQKNLTCVIHYFQDVELNI